MILADSNYNELAQNLPDKNKPEGNFLIIANKKDVK